jgi:transposase
MSKKPSAIKLTKADRGALEKFVAHGKKSAREITRARLLLLADEGRKERELMESLGVSRGPVSNVRKKYQTQTYDDIVELLHDAPRSGRPLKLDSRVEAKVTLIACSAPPEGRGRWTLHRIADQLVKLEVTEASSHESVRRRLKQTTSSPGS